MAIYKDIMETIHMLEQEHLDIRTTTMGISLLDCFGREQEDLRHPHRTGQRAYHRRLAALREGSGRCRKGCRGRYHRRLFRAGPQRLYPQ